MSIEKRIQVFSEGNLSSKIAIVGEALGEVEVKFQRPFVGPAGNLLNNLLSSAGINRSSCYITNVIKEHPPKNNISEFVNLTKKYPVETDEFKEYRELLKSELMDSGANVILALGNVPLYTLTGLRQITKRRGSILESSLIPGRKVIPTIHPSSALRFGNYVQRYFILFDLIRASEQADFPEIILPKRNLIIKPSFFEAMRWIEEFSKHDSIGFDIETLRNKLSHFSISDILGETAISVALFSGGLDLFSPEEERDLVLALNKMLQSVDFVIGQNLNFDSSFLLREYGIVIDPKKIHDTMIAHGVLAPEFPKALDFLTSIYTLEPYYKDEGKQHIKDQTSSDSFHIYSAKDAAVVGPIWNSVSEDLQKQGNYKTYLRQRDVLGPISFMQQRGVRVDVEGLRKQGDLVGKKIEELTENLHKVAGVEINPNSPKQLQTYFYIDKKIPPYHNRKTGAIAVDKSALKRMARKGIEEAKILLEIRKLSKQKGTYLDVVLRNDNRLVGSYNPVGTKFSRLSSSKNLFGEGTNMQNLDDCIKEFLLADKGYFFINVDLAQAENRIVAHIAPDHNMIEAFETNRRVHAVTASLISGLSYERVLEEKRLEIPCHIGDGTKTWDFFGKKSNHAFNYGWGPHSFAYELEISNKEGTFLRDGYLKSYPGIPQYWRWIKDEIYKSRRLVNIYGRIYEFKGMLDQELWKRAYSYIPQSTVGDIINEKGLNYIYYDQENFSPVELLMQVHDSVLFQIPFELSLLEISDILNKIKRSLETPLEWKGSAFVIPAEFEIGLSYKTMKSVDVTNDVELKESIIKLREDQ